MLCSIAIFMVLQLVLFYLGFCPNPQLPLLNLWSLMAQATGNSRARGSASTDEISVIFPYFPIFPKQREVALCMKLNCRRLLNASLLV